MTPNTSACLPFTSIHLPWDRYSETDYCNIFADDDNRETVLALKISEEPSV